MGATRGEDAIARLFGSVGHVGRALLDYMRIV